MNLEHAETVLRMVNREVWIITSADGSRRGGLAASWVQPASIDAKRPVLVVGITPNHFTAELIHASGSFAAHLLRTDQIGVAWNFAQDSGRSRDKLSELSITHGETGSPILTDCLAWCECRVFSHVDAGDRVLYWADVVGGKTISQGQPLREQDLIRELTSEQRTTLLAAREADAMIQRPKHEAWRKSSASLSLNRPAKHNQQ